MSSFFNRLKRASKAAIEGMQSTTYRFHINERDVTCLRCGHNRFEKGRAQLNTPGLTFLDLDWANKTATLLICSACGKIEWFKDEPDLKE